MLTDTRTATADYSAEERQRFQTAETLPLHTRSGNSERR
jgi:hypothetical protein